MRLRLPRSRRTWAVLFLLSAVVCVCGRYGLRSHAYERADRELREVMAELDAAEPGWRYADMIAARPEVPEAENGALIAERHGVSVQAGRTQALDKEFTAFRKTGGDLRKLERLLKPFGPNIEALRGMHRLTKGRFDWPDGIPPGYMDFLETAKLLTVDSLVQAGRGDATRAGQSLLAVARLGYYCGADQTMMGVLNGKSIHLVLGDALRLLSERIAIPREYLEGIAQTLAAARTEYAFKQVARMERAFHHYLFDENLRGTGMAGPLVFKAAEDAVVDHSRQDPKDRIGAAGRAEREAKTLRLWSRAIDAVDESPGTRWDIHEDIAELVPEGQPWSILRDMNHYCADRVVGADKALLVEAAVNILLLRGRAGAWPATLDAIGDLMPLKSVSGEPIGMTLEGNAVTLRIRNISHGDDRKPIDLSYSFKVTPLK